MLPISRLLSLACPRPPVADLTSRLSRSTMRAVCKTTPTNDVLEAGLRRDSSSQPFMCLHNTATGPLTVTVGRAPRVAKCVSASSTEPRGCSVQLFITDNGNNERPVWAASPIPWEASRPQANRPRIPTWFVTLELLFARGNCSRQATEQYVHRHSRAYPVERSFKPACYEAALILPTWTTPKRGKQAQA